MIQLILTFAQHDERIRIVSMEGSRVNSNVKPDAFQDYDITFIVTDMESFKQDDAWLEYFGKRIMMQKPEAMSLFPSHLGGWFSYLMLFEDGNRIDLKLVPVTDLKTYLASDTLLTVLLDKDELVHGLPQVNDSFHHIRKPTFTCFDDCCNEFWWVSTYVVKGLYRRQFLYAAEHLERNVRTNLLRMLAWKVGTETDFSVNLGKEYTFLNHHIPQEEWEKLCLTYCNASLAEI